MRPNKTPSTVIGLSAGICIGGKCDGTAKVYGVGSNTTLSLTQLLAKRMTTNNKNNNRFIAV